jgi:maltooligosyltrehalose trehalohydrolase
MTRRFRHDLPFGAKPLAINRTVFRFFAPSQSSVAVEIEGMSPIAMQRCQEGWYEAEAPCGPGARYRYRLGTGETVPDPASRAQAGDVHGASIVVNPEEYIWRHPDWRGRPWHEAVIYELHVGMFGGFARMVPALSALAELGVTAIELMPIADFPGERNWGYDGVLPYAPDSNYGAPDDLKALIDAAHEHGLLIYLDVVYNHFGPDGNYIAAYSPEFFRNDVSTPWGPAIDFRRPQVRRFFTENALYWLMEYRFDGLRFDAVHAITEPGWLDEMAATVRATVEPGRHIHLVLENDANMADHLRHGFDAQWNDDAHHVLHVLLTGETEGYYEDYVEDCATKLARSLAEGFIYQGEPSPHRNGAPRGTSSSDLPPTAFVMFLQNHDQIGNRAFGERLTALADPAALEAAIALQILSPQIPLLFMGEENASRTPFLFFTDHQNHELADAVRNGRRQEFAKFAAFADAATREAIPDPNAQTTFQQSMPVPDPERGVARRALYRNLLALRRNEIMPRLPGSRAIEVGVAGHAAVVATWRLGDGSLLSIATNLGKDAVDIDRLPPGRLLFGSWPTAGVSVRAQSLRPQSTVAFLETPA